MDDKPVKRKRGKPAKIIEEALYEQVAALAATGASRNQIAKSLEISPFYVNKIYKSEKFKGHVKEIADDAVSAVKDNIRFRMSGLANDIISALVYQLRERNSVEAVKVALKVLGFGEEEQVKQDTKIQVVLPGSKQEDSIDAKYRIQNEED